MKVCCVTCISGYENSVYLEDFMKPIEKMTPKEKLLYKKKLLEQKAQLQAQAMPLLAREDYAAYVEYVHLYDTDFKMAPFQKWICNRIDDLLENRLLNKYGKPYKGILWSQPAQTGKSRCGTETLPSYFLGKNPTKHVIEVSYSGTFAERFGRRNIEKINDYGKQLFGIEISQEKKATDEFELAKTKGGMISRGIEGQITGNPGDLIIIDDPYKSMQEADSVAWQKTLMDVWMSAIKMRASARCKFVIVHTRWNEDDLIGYLLANEPDEWFEINLPMEFEEDFPEIGKKAGDSLLPESGKTIEWVQKEKKSFLRDPSNGGTRVWNAAYQGRPSSLEGNMIKRDYWKRYALTLEMQRQGFFPVKIQAWDCSVKETGDPVAGQVWGKLGANYYITDHKGGRMTIVQNMDGIKDWAEKYPDATAKVIEDKANGPAIIQMLRTSIHGLIPVNPGTSNKAERVNVVLPLMISGNVYIPDKIEVSPGIFETCTWADEIIEQCASFKPNKKVQKDDEVDALSLGLTWLMYLPATPTATEQKHDTFLHGDKKENPYECNVTDSFISYGMGG